MNEYPNLEVFETLPDDGCHQWIPHFCLDPVTSEPGMYGEECARCQKLRDHPILPPGTVQTGTSSRTIYAVIW